MPQVVKQRYQAKVLNGSQSLVQNVAQIVRTEGVLGGLYKGYGITIMREIPFAWVQFPLYEWMKVHTPTLVFSTHIHTYCTPLTHPHTHT